MLLVVQLGFSQLYQVGHTTVNFTDPSRSNRVIATEIYYPADVAGDNVAMTTSTTAAFPVLCFGHGFVMTWDAYQNYWSFLVPKGYIMAFPKTEGSLSPSHLDYGKDLAFVVDQMTLLGNTSSSVFYNRVSPMNAVMGHSMGGGAAFLAAQLSANIKTLVTMAPAETNPSAIQAATAIAIPALLFAGGNDCVTPPNTNQIPMYNGLGSTCKTLLTIIGGSHCQMANSNFLCGVGESSCTPQPTITRTAQQAIINTYLLPWLDFQLKGNCTQGNAFDTQIVADTGIAFQKNCIQCNNLAVTTVENNHPITIAPNPAKEFMTITGREGVTYQITVYDSTAKQLLSKAFTTETTIATENLPKGIYWYALQSNEKTIRTGKFIK